MRKIYLLSFLVFSCFIAQAQIVNIPDPIFKAALLNYQPSIDTNDDNEIQVSEALLVTTLNFSNENYIPGNPQNITGIQSFTNVTSITINLTNVPGIDLTGLNNLQHLNCAGSYQMTSLNLTGLFNLQTLDCSNCYNLISLDLNGFTNLQNLNCSGCFDLTSLNTNGLTNLQTLNCSNSINLASLSLSGLNNLQTFNSTDCRLSTLDLTGISSLTSVICNRNRLTSIITTGATNITHFECAGNELTALSVTGMTNLQYLDCSFQQAMSTFPMGSISVLDLTGLNLLTFLNCSSNSLTALDVSHLTNLTYLSCSYNDILSLNVVPLINLTQLYCGGNALTSLDVSSLTHLTNFDCHSNTLPNLNIDNLTALTNIDCGQNAIPSLNVSNNTALKLFACAGNLLTTLNVGNLVNLDRLICSSNQLTTIDVSNLHHLTSIEVGYNLFATLDFSQTITYNEFQYLYYNIGGNPNLTYVNLKNGTNMGFGPLSAFNCPNLQYICADDFNIQSIQQGLDDFLSTTPDNVQVNSYCTFVPGGIHNTISGTATLDINNNGCDTNDIHPRDFRVNINDGILTGATFSQASGNFSFFTQTGSFILTPQFENPYFSVTPATATLTFPSLDESTQTQNFCIIPNGVHNDLEITLFPMANARPGFDANYVLIYRNKGNQVLSGNIDLTFDDAVLDFVSAVPALNNQSLNNLTWNYSNLLPFESRSISFTLNLNGPMETPAVNIDDILHFGVTINPVSGDETIDDNTFTLAQTVRGSFDPNDKVCLEGNFITPENVGDYLHYVIHFQNSGTAPAENIVVKDDIDATKFDISTLQLTSASHPQVTRINGNKVEFVFEGINLPAEIDNEPASHGYVAFKIKTKNNLVLGNNVSNTANIYFDYNFPIVTNTTSTTVSNLGTGDFENTSVSVYPNPVKNILSITAKDNITSIQLFDIQGRLVSTKLTTSMEASIDLSQQTSGVYFLKVYTDNGMKVEKVIKQ
jgi:Leucine-rich repeat (LRR) protein